MGLEVLRAVKRVCKEHSQYLWHIVFEPFGEIRVFSR
jgi:hypothetical protein